MGELDAPTIAKEPPTLERERVEVFLRRPGGALSLTRLLLPEEVVIDIPHLGNLVLRPRCYGIEGQALLGLASSGEAFRLDATEGGALLVERNFARHLVNAMAGAPASLLPRPLSRIERGMVAGLVAVSLAKLGLPLGIEPVAEAGVPPMEDPLCIQVLAHLRGSDGLVWLCASASAATRVWQMYRIPAAAPILRMELARTQLPRADAMTACPQDLVVFDDSPACSASASLAADICYRSKRVSVCLDPDGRVRMDDEMQETRRILPPSKPGLAPGLVEVTAELAGTTELSTASSLHSGSGVLLRMGESDWAEGTLGAHHDRLAVRITRVLMRTCAG